MKDRLMIPAFGQLKLEDVIGRRDLGRLRLATRAEIAELSGEIASGLYHGMLENWRIVAIDLLDGLPEFVFLGSRDNEYWGTSPIRAIDLEAGRACTQSGSIYTLSTAGQGAPPLGHVLHMCFMLHAWGMGRTLAVPEVSY